MDARASFAFPFCVDFVRCGIQNTDDIVTTFYLSFGYDSIATVGEIRVYTGGPIFKVVLEC